MRLAAIISTPATQGLTFQYLKVQQFQSLDLFKDYFMLVF